MTKGRIENTAMTKAIEIANHKQGAYEVSCDPATGLCTAKLRVSAKRAYEIPESRRSDEINSAVKRAGDKAEYLGFGFKIETRDVDTKKRTATFVASTPQVDRYGDVINQDGWELANYQANPIILFAHDSRSLPIGRAIDCGFDANGNLRVSVQFAKAVGSYDLPETVLQYVSDGYLNTVSVGFIPLEYQYRFEQDDEGNQLPYPSGRIYTKCELLEVSVVPVPANPGAVVVHNAFEKAFSAIEIASEDTADPPRAIKIEDVERAYFVFDAKEKVVHEHGSYNPFDHENKDAGADFILVKLYADGQNRPFSFGATEAKRAQEAAHDAMLRDANATQGFLCELIGADAEERPVYRSLKLLVRTEIDSKEFANHNMEQKPCTCKNHDGAPHADAAAVEEKSVVPFHAYPLAPSNAPWDASKEMGSTKDPADWKKMSTIVSGDPKNKGSYKLPHHKGPGAKFATVRRGVANALARANQVAGVSSADKSGAKAHLTKHMAEFHKKDGKDFDVELFAQDLAAMETFREALPVEVQEAYTEDMVKFILEPEGNKSAIHSARIYCGAVVDELKTGIVKNAATLLTATVALAEETRKFTNDKANKKIAKAHKSMSSAKDELHEAHEDAMGMLGEAVDLMKQVGDTKGMGTPGEYHPDESVKSKVERAYELAASAKTTVRRAAERYKSHMNNATDHLEALMEYMGKDAADGDGDGDGDGDSPNDNPDKPADKKPKSFFDFADATNTDKAASKEVTGAVPIPAVNSTDDFVAKLFRATE